MGGRGEDWHTLALLPVGMKTLHNKRQSPQPGIEVPSTLRTFNVASQASRACEAKYLPAQSAFEPHLAGGQAGGANFDSCNLIVTPIKIQKEMAEISWTENSKPM